MRSRAVLHQPARSPTPHGQSTVEGCGLKTPDTGCLVGSLPGFTRVVSVGWLFLEQGRGDQTLTAGPFFDRIIEAPAPLRSSPHFYQGSDKHKQLCRPAGGETEAPRWPTAHPGKGRTLQTPAPPAPSPHHPCEESSLLFSSLKTLVTLHSVTFARSGGDPKTASESAAHPRVP